LEASGYRTGVSTTSYPGWTGRLREKPFKVGDTVTIRDDRFSPLTNGLAAGAVVQITRDEGAYVFVTHAGQEFQVPLEKISSARQYERANGQWAEEAEYYADLVARRLPKPGTREQAGSDPMFGSRN
jgi:hypothetical protein